MIPIFDDGFGGYLVLLVAGFLAHEPWRWLGLVIGSNLSETSPVFVWVRAVATALVAGLVMRLVIFPVGVLAKVDLPLRLVAIAVGSAVFFIAGRRLGIGILAGALTLCAGVILLGRSL